jgi:zeaxanthin glucosyltransferase
VHFGIISPPVSGHIHPFGALGRELLKRGHRVSLIHMSDLGEAVRTEGLEFIPIGRAEHPPGSLAESLAQLRRLDGFAALRFTIGAISKTTEMVCRDAPAAIRDAKIDALLVDQTEPAGGAVAEYLNIPFVTVCNALIMNREAYAPPPFTPWKYHRSPVGQVRNWFGYIVSDALMRPIWRIVGDYRNKWKLPPLKSADDTFSRILQISQQPAAFDFPRKALPEHFHYVGPLRNESGRVIPFPWEKLDGRPLVYASLGTLQTGKERIFRCFAEACVGFDVQLVITHGGGLTEAQVNSFPGDPLLVSYAPQLDVLAHARLTLTHAGLNTVLDSLTYGVPVVAIPITYEQPAIASRIRWSGVGEVIPLRRLNVDKLRGALQRVLSDSSYSWQAEKIRNSIQQSGGATRASDLIEHCTM